MPDRPYVIALEEHFQDPELGALYGPLDANAAAHVRERLESFGTHRLKDMDDAGVDFQVISHSAPSVQKLDAAAAVRDIRVMSGCARIVATTTTIPFGGMSGGRAR